MSRDALNVGINSYTYPNSLKAPATDAEAIAQQLEQDGGFRVMRLPSYLDALEDDVPKVAQHQDVTRL